MLTQEEREAAAYSALEHSWTLAFETDPVALTQALESSWNVIRDAAISNPHTPLPPVLDRINGILTDPNPLSQNDLGTLRAAAARPDLPDSVWEALLIRSTMTEVLVKSPNTPAWVLRTLTFEKPLSIWDVLAVTGNPNSDFETLMRAVTLKSLTSTTDRWANVAVKNTVWQIHRGAFTEEQQGALTSRLLGLLLGCATEIPSRSAWHDWQHAALNILSEPCPAEVMRELWENVNDAFEGDSSWPGTADTAGYDLLRRIMEQENCPVDALMAGCCSESRQVRDAALANPNCPEEGRISAALMR